MLRPILQPEFIVHHSQHSTRADLQPSFKGNKNQAANIPTAHDLANSADSRKKCIPLVVDTSHDALSVTLRIKSLLVYLPAHLDKIHKYLNKQGTLRGTRLASLGSTTSSHPIHPAAVIIILALVIQHQTPLDPIWREARGVLQSKSLVRLVLATTTCGSSRWTVQTQSLDFQTWIDRTQTSSIPTLPCDLSSPLTIPRVGQSSHHLKTCRHQSEKERERQRSTLTEPDALTRAKSVIHQSTFIPSPSTWASSLIGRQVDSAEC